MRKINIKLLSKTIISILIIIVFTSCNSTKPTNSNVDKYLNKNHSNLILDKDDFSSFNLLDKDLKQNEIFLTGEVHGAAANGELELKFLKYLKEKTNIKYYLCELPYSHAYYLNKYLNTGDESILKELFIEWKDTASYTIEHYNKWIEVYELNKTLPDDEKIQVVGIDIEHQQNIAIRYMYSLIPKNEPPEEIKPVIKKLQHTYENNITNPQILKNLSLDLKKSINENYDIYKRYLGEKFFDFNLVTDNLCVSFEFSLDNATFYNLRDMQMYKNFIHIYNTLPKGKFYGQFGAYHVTQRSIYDNTYYLASLMENEESPVKGKVISIIYMYNNCTTYNPMQSPTIHTTNTLRENNVFKDYLKTDTTLFKLNGGNSPFNKNLIWQLQPNSGIPTEGVTTDYYQYIVVIKNSPPMEEIK
ncbi:hypothetical protein [uncultured Clostridium sp.]|uniref:hypothetical protein n=1 Tax=uncultured Clostridium sp. TaxID=59620 RepID=UPI0028E3EFE9|nr:hypothetical protein [uncultured Clostridium sp.]